MMVPPHMVFSELAQESGIVPSPNKLKSMKHANLHKWPTYCPDRRESHICPNRIQYHPRLSDITNAHQGAILMHCAKSDNRPKPAEARTVSRDDVAYISYGTFLTPLPCVWMLPSSILIRVSSQPLRRCSIEE